MKDTTLSSLTIGQLARHTGVGIEAIRFYERRGLIPKPPRSVGGYRKFPADTIHRLHFIQRAKALGFSLDDIHQLLTLRIRRQGSCRAVQAKAQQQLDAISLKIRELRRMQRALRTLLASCDAKAPTSACPILDALAGHKENIS
jgi:MerR family transcriptional regulator, copper efflux regulator